MIKSLKLSSQENEQCERGSCICSPPFYVDQFDGNRCKSPCDRFSCGLNAECTPSNPPQVSINGDDSEITYWNVSIFIL